MSDKSPDNLPTLSDIFDGALNTPIPKEVKNSLIKAIANLITGAFDVPAAWLESKAKEIRDTSRGKGLVIEGAAKSAALKFETEDDLAKRAVEYFGNRILKEQKNREKIVAAAVSHVINAPESGGNDREIDEDWLYHFGKVAETKSNEEIQGYFSKLLASEIRRPGSISPQTIDVLAKLTPRTAKTFELFCSISSSFPGLINDPFVIASPFGAPGQNALSKYGLSYASLCDLQDAGLIQNDLNAWREAFGIIFIHGFEIANKIIKFKGDINQTKSHRMNVVNFSFAGKELRGIIEVMPNKEYEKSLTDWICSTYMLALETT